MVDTLSLDARSKLMGRVRGKNTAPELAVRCALHAAGYRFRIHRKDLSGCPDIVLPRYRIAIFVHGCFWHRHASCPASSTPRQNSEFWRNKFANNVRRDRRNARQLRKLGYRVMTIWECQIVNPERLVSRIVRFLDKG